MLHQRSHLSSSGVELWRLRLSKPLHAFLAAGLSGASGCPCATCTGVGCRCRCRAAGRCRGIGRSPAPVRGRVLHAQKAEGAQVSVAGAQFVGTWNRAEGRPRVGEDVPHEVARGCGGCRRRSSRRAACRRGLAARASHPSVPSADQLIWPGADEQDVHA